MLSIPAYLNHSLVKTPVHSTSTQVAQAAEGGKKSIDPAGVCLLPSYDCPEPWELWVHALFARFSTET